MTASTQTTRPTHCPNCGVKLPDIPISLCAYCAMPVVVAGEKAADGVSPNAGRIAKIAQQPAFETLQNHHPQETPEYFLGGRLVWHGRNFILLGVVLGVLGLMLSSSKLLLPWSAFGVVSIVIGAVMMVRGAGVRGKATASPITKRPGMIIDRRSETELRGWNGDTRYYFTIEFEDGAVGEYGFAGRGATEDPYPNGMTGLAFLRGSNLLELQHIRV
ncbi:MAG: hypothetical protein KDB61_12255 [Planctomycetes bacterium]|nr:hypothetical protein [Planctomycetota bacterium]